MNVDSIQSMVQKDGIVFLTYGGFLSQALISGMTEALEKEAEVSGLSIGNSSDIFTVFIELSQNMMNYSKMKTGDGSIVKSEGLIIVSKDEDDSYFINSQNIVAQIDKEKMEPKLLEVTSLDKESIKKRYKELRRSGAHAHGKGGGIGFYEIAKRCDQIQYEFKKINEDRYYFHIKAIIKTKKENH